MEKELIGIIIGAAASAVIGLIAVGVAGWLKKRVKVVAPHDTVLKEQARQLVVQQKLVLMLVDLTKPQLLALLGIIEALRPNMNGTFERAHAGVTAALDKFDDTMRSIVGGECAEPAVAGST